jgi:type VI protein secretion system component Hcp
MKRITGVLFASLLFAGAASTLSAQQSIYMFVDSIRGDQVTPHDREFKLNSYSSALMNAISVGSASTGAAAGRASSSPVKISMRANPASTAAFFRHVAAGTRLPSIEIRFYNSTRMFSKTVFENAYLTNIATEAADETQQEIEFVYSRVKWFASPDASGLTPPVQTGCWDFALARGC